jgi:hypothetical protein
MSKRSASKASFIATTASMIAWVTIIGKCMIAFCEDCESAKVAVIGGALIASAIPLGLIIGYVVSPLIYKGCNLSGLHRYTHAIFVHVIVGVVIWAMYLFFERFDLHSGLWLVVAYPVYFSIVCGPMVIVPSLIGTLAYAYWSCPALQEAAA